jgi:peptidoglycan/xylan/chitin deacetylase (PgdA/CDA1 family)
MRRVILNFHGLGTPGRALEPGEAVYWVSEDFFAGTLDLAARLMPRVETHFTFDDGNLSDLGIAAPLLARHGRQAQFFVLSDRIGQAGSLGPQHIRALQEAGHLIGNHGATHVDWKRLDEAGRAREMDTARTAIVAVTGRPVTTAAIPFGRYDAGVLRALEARGYDRVYSSDGGAWRSDRAPIPRSSPRADMSLADIEAILLGRESQARRLRRRLTRAVKRRF